MFIGTTFSHRHATYLSKDNKRVLDAALNFGFDYLRIGCYWDEIEIEKGTYDFSAIIDILTECEAKKQKVVLTLGMKAPRWPEYYFPAWLPTKTPQVAQEYVGDFIQNAVTELRKYQCFTHWQIENEPLDPSGPEHFVIQPAELRKEIILVKQYDKRPIIVNIWGNELTKRNLIPQIVSEADIIGLDIYYKVPWIGKLYRGPSDSDTKLKRIIMEMGKPVWITELQAEPWERDMTVATGVTPSMNPALLKQNFDRAMALQPGAIFLWGFEYWYYKAQQGDDSLWKAAQEIVAKKL